MPTLWLVPSNPLKAWGEELFLSEQEGILSSGDPWASPGIRLSSCKSGLQSLDLPASLYQHVSQFPIIILFIHTYRSFLFLLWPLICTTIWIKKRAWIQHKIHDMLIQTCPYEMYHICIEYMLIKTASASEFFVTSFPKYYIVQWSI